MTLRVRDRFRAWVRYHEWIPIQPCQACRRWYWGHWPERGWRAAYQEYCSRECYVRAEGPL